MSSRFLPQVKALFFQGVRAELATPERWLSPLLFSATVLILFSFAMGKPAPGFAAEVLVAETFLTAFLALQISFSRTFEPDTHDRVFDVLKTYPISPAAWYLSKYALVVVMGAMILVPTIILASIFHSESGINFVTWPIMVVALLALAGLAAVGVLLSTMTMGSGAKQLLYPILYFPLTTPVLLAAVETSLALLRDGEPLAASLSSWLGLLVIFDIIYLTLGILLFGELVKPE